MLSGTMAKPRWDSSRGVSSAYIAGLLGKSNLRAIIALLRSKGADVKIAPDSDTIDYITTWKILNARVEITGDESHSLTSKGVRNGNFELLIASMLQGMNFLDGMRRLAEGAEILRPDLRFNASLHSGLPHLNIRFLGETSLAREIYIEALTVVLHCAFCWALETRLSPRKVRGPALIDGRNGSLLALLGQPVKREGAGVTVVYDKASAPLKFRAHNFRRWHDGGFAEYTKLAHALSAKTSNRSEEHDDIVRAVRKHLLEGVVDQEAVAEKMAMSVATLRRRLADRGESFRGILTAIRRDAAEVLLLGGKSVDDMAAELGLSDSRCFRRACHAWFGASPSSVRRLLRNEAGGKTR